MHKLYLVLLCVLIFASQGFCGEEKQTPFFLAMSVENIKTMAAWYEEHLDFEIFERNDLPERGIYVTFLRHGDFIIEMGQRGDSFFVADKVDFKKNPRYGGSSNSASRSAISTAK